ncbi:hypothetical protein [Erysipelothrix aquatica]|uniref:hypothetical protein n=1 Tax=Erysipelothrix aquatica TaxID=2683714 RepID=UPI001356917A|nr:hypothetical protein [Erysipelothrix aquatica]
MKSADQEEIIGYIHNEMIQAKKRGLTEITLVSGEIHNDLGYMRRMTSVCQAMYKCMDSKDVIMHSTPSGMSSTITIKYFLD